MIRPARLPIAAMFACSIVTSVLWTAVSGQDLNFDLITYHYYLGYSAFASRLSLDFLAASYQGYQSPLPYMLLYVLDAAGVPPLVNAAIHAAVHSLNLVLLFMITCSIVGPDSGMNRRALIAAFWLLGAIAPIYWSLVGTSFPDLFTSVPVLAGVWLIARGLTHPSRQHALCLVAGGAALMGIATGIRFHNAVYVLAMLCALAASNGVHGRAQYRIAATFTVSAASGWILFFAPWAYELYKEFRNPVFPLYNAVFRSPDFPAANLPISSFSPEGLSDLLTLPFRMATHADAVYGETPLPDARPAALAVAALGLLGHRLFCLRAGHAVSGNRELAADDAATADRRHLVIAFFALSAALWVATSTNARYGAALFLLAGPVCGVILARFLLPRHILLLIGALLLWQALLQQIFFRQYRPPHTAWASRYFDWQLSDPMKRTPATYLSFSYRTGSVLAPYMHPESSHVNLVGQYTPNFNTPGSQRINKAIARHESLYAIFDAGLIPQRPLDWNDFKAYFKTQIRFWALDFTDRDCEVIAPRQSSRAWERFDEIIGIKPAQALAFISCELRPVTVVDRDRARAELKDFERKVARLGTTCPAYFGKPLSYIRVANTWTVTSFATFQVRLDFEDQGAFYLQEGRAPYARLELGRMKEDQLTPYEPDCRVWFSRLSELSNEAAQRGMPKASGP
jgi:hypothetical protein